MAITLTIQDSTDTRTYNVLVRPVISAPIIRETDVETLDGNISTYYSATKQNLTFELGYMSPDNYALLKAFRDRQYVNKKYPTITVSGATNLAITNLTAKMTLNEQRVITNCGVVEGVSVNFRESKQI